MSNNTRKVTKDNALLSYKGFFKGHVKNTGVCRGHTFEANKEYKVEGAIKTCNNGFHACKKPEDVLSFYPYVPYTCRTPIYAKVKQWGEVHEDCKKIASSHIEVIEFLTIGQFQKIVGIDSASIAKERAEAKKRHEKAKLAAIKASIYTIHKKSVAVLGGRGFYSTTIVNTVPHAYLAIKDVRNIVSKGVKATIIGNFRTFKGAAGCKFVHTNGKIYTIGKDGIKANIVYELKKGKVVQKAKQ